MRLFKFTDEIMGSEVHCSLKQVCEAKNSAVLPYMVKSYEQLCLPLVPVTSNYVSKPLLLHPFSGILCLLKKM